MPETFQPLTWRNDQNPAINETNLNRLETSVEVIDDRVATLELGAVTAVTVPYATAVTINATQGAVFRCVATGDITLDDIVGGIDGQTVVFQVFASAGSRVLSFTGSVTALTVPAGQWWVGVFRYVAGTNTWLLGDETGGTGSSGTSDPLAISSAMVDAKGDLIAATANDTVARLPVGASGQVLTATPGATAGVAWATVPTALGDAHTVYSLNPPGALTPIAANGSTNDAATLQAHLDYVKNTFGGGRVALPAGRTIKCNAGLTVPSRVQLVSHQSTTLDFTGMSTGGSAITVSDTDFVPLIGVQLVGPQSTRLLTDTSRGIRVVNGVRLRLYDCKIKHFGRGLDWASSDTWLCSMVGGAIEECGTCVYNANVEAGATNAGEMMVLDNVTLYNSRRAIDVSGNGVNFQLNNCSLDYCTEMGRIADAWVYFTGCHIESNGSTSTFGYLFKVTNNSKVSLVNTDVIMGSGGITPLCYLFDPTEAPFNFGNGRALFAATKIYSQKPSGGDTLWHSEVAYVWPGAQASKVEFTPFPIRWTPISAQFVAQDFFVQGPETLRVTAMPSNGATGQFTLTASPTPPDDRMVRVKLG